MNEASIATSFAYELPIERQLPLIREAGFTRVSLWERSAHSGYLHRRGRVVLQRFLRENGLMLDSFSGARSR
jgi:hypothetical protein